MFWLQSSPRKRRQLRPFLEVLEGRCLLTTVTNLNDAGAGSLRQAIVDTPSGGTVDFESDLSGTIGLTSGELLIAKNLTVTGPGSDAITVSGTHTSRVFDVSSGSTVTLSGLTIADGMNANSPGGGILNNGTLTIDGSTIQGNLAVGNGNIHGGGIDNTGTLVVTDSDVSNNTVSGTGDLGGGGIDNERSGSLTLSDSTITGNVFHVVSQATGSGSGLSNLGNMSLSGCVVRANSGFGGTGIYNALFAVATIDNSIISDHPEGALANQGGTLTVTYSTIQNNTAAFGAGILVSGGTVTVENSTVSNNMLDGNGHPNGGGGIAASGTVILDNSTISGNAALQAQGPMGGGIFMSGGSLSMTSCTVSANASATGGGVLVQAGVTVNMRNTIIAGNTASASPDVSGQVASQGHNLIGDGTGSSGYTDTDLVGTSDQPIDPVLGPLADNGGPTQTMALLPGSPAIDAGDNTGAAQWDQRGPGFARIVHGTIDIGAFEAQNAVVDVTCSVATDLLWPPRRQFVNVGFTVDVNPPDSNIQVLVYGNDHSTSGDVRDIGPETLRLRADRQRQGYGRVYLLVAEATDSLGATGFDVCAVVVPRSNTPEGVFAVRAQAAAAESQYRQTQTVPPGFHLLGQSGSGSAGDDRALGSDRHAVAVGSLAVDPPSDGSSSMAAVVVSDATPANAPTSAELACLGQWTVDGYFVAPLAEYQRAIVSDPASELADAMTDSAIDAVLGADALVS